MEYGQKTPPWPQKQIILPIFSRMPDLKSGKHFVERLKRFVSAGGIPATERYHHIVACIDHKEKEIVFLRDLIHFAKSHRSAELFGNLQKLPYYLNAATLFPYLDLNTYLVDEH